MQRSRFLPFLSLILLSWRVQLAEGSWEWEDWDYYQMLGLEADENSSSTVNATAIKQGYRRQARLFHPDKQQNQNKKEATERFRRIAEAYEVLSDPEQKAMYDQFLRSSSSKASPSTRPTASSPSSSSSSSTEERSFFSWDTFRDPLKVFEEFFFAQDDDDDDDGKQDWWHGGSTTTNNNPWNDGNFNDNDTMNNQHEEQSWYYHPQFGQVLRVTRYQAENIVYQDFVEDWDPYRGSWGWYPLYPQPILLRSKSTLGPHEVLSPPAVLRNGPFTAGFFHTCQFQIRRGSTVLWQALERQHVMMLLSSRDIMTTSQCHVALHGSQLVLQINGMPVWYTPMARQRDDGEWSQNFSHGGYHRRPSFEARLDDDGTLTVYRKVDDDDDVTSMDLLDQLQAWIGKDPRCCYSTSPAGCHRLGRLLFRVLTLNRRLGTFWQRLGGLLTRFLNWLEGEDEDEEHFDYYHDNRR